MKYVFDILFGILFGAWIVIAPMNNETILQWQWVGIAIGIGLAFTISKWNKDKIDELERKIEELKKNDR